MDNIIQQISEKLTKKILEKAYSGGICDIDLLSSSILEDCKSAARDILEEIVGEIHDESDEKEDELVQKISDREYIIEGSMHLDDVNDHLDTELDSEDYDSLGGFIIEHLDRLPEVGDEVCTDNGIRLIVEALDKNRVESVRMYLPEKHDADNKSELSSSESAAQTAFTEEK